MQICKQCGGKSATGIRSAKIVAFQVQAQKMWNLHTKHHVQQPENRKRKTNELKQSKECEYTFIVCFLGCDSWHSNEFAKCSLWEK